MSKTEGNPERTVEGFVSTARLPEEPRLARLCTFVSRTGEVTSSEGSPVVPDANSLELRTD